MPSPATTLLLPSAAGALFWLEHATGAGTLALQVYAVLNPNDTRLRQTSACGNGLAAGHNAIIGSSTAAALNLLFLVRNLLSIRFVELSGRTKALVCAFFVACALFLAVWTWNGPISLLLAAGSCAATYAYLYLSGSWLRLVIGVNMLAWTINAVAFNSPWQLVSGLLGSSAAFWGAWRLRQQVAAPAAL